MSTDTTPSNGDDGELVLFVENRRILVVGVEGSNNPGTVVEELTGHFRCFIVALVVVLVQQQHVLLIVVARVAAFLGRRNTSNNCADERRAVTLKADMIENSCLLPKYCCVA